MKANPAPVLLIFPDGTELAGKGATDVLLRLGRLQWTPTEDVRRIKSLLSDRAWAWSRFTLDPELPDDEYLTALDASRLCAVVWGPHPAQPKQPTILREARHHDPDRNQP